VSLPYVEGKNVILEYRYADGKLDLRPQLAPELVRLKVDAIVTRSTAPIRAAKVAPMRFRAVDGGMTATGVLGTLTLR